MKKIYLFAAMAAMLASCSSDDLTVEKQSPQTQQNGEEQAVMFDSYVNRTTTRAGQTGDITTDKLDDEWKPDGTPSPSYGGFGVFAYYTNNNDYDQFATPNFMYNQLVTYETTAPAHWKYTPVKYWPNEYGTNAISDDADRVSFFAYAPYVEVTPASGKPISKNANNAKEVGITQLSRNTATGDPIVKYVASFNAEEAVDLCWAVSETNTWTTVNEGTRQDLKFGLPWLNVKRPAEAKTQAEAGQRVKFNFKHALAKMQVNVDAYVDGTDNTNDVNDQTRIFIRSVRFNGFAMKGALNLNNETAYQPYWLNYNGVGDLEAEGDIVVYDGRRDGKEGMDNATASNEKSLGLNPQFIQIDEMVAAGTWKPSTGDPGDDDFVPTGVTKGSGTPTKPLPLFDGGGVFYVIPVSGEQVEVEIVYDVETCDPNLANTISDGRTPGSSVENHITKKITFGNAASSSLEAGKGYVINLHLGMNSVKFDADVVDWDNIQPDAEVDLPANMPVVDVNATSSPILEIPGHVNGADTYKYYFAVRGFDGGETVTPTVATGTPILTYPVVSSTGDLSSGDNKANINGIVYVETTVNAYKGVKNVDAKDDITFSSVSGKTVTLKVKQLAVKLGLAAPANLAKADTYDLQRNLTGSPATWIDLGGDAITGYDPSNPPTNNYIRVWVNGAELTLDSTPSDVHFTFDKSNGKIGFKSSFIKANDQIKVTIKCGDVPEETITFTAS